MEEGEFQASLSREVERYALESARRGIWAPTSAAQASKAEFDQLLPRGRETPGFRFCEVVEEPAGRRVGETWFSMREKGGVVQSWIHWLWIDPPYRRRGLARQVLNTIEQEAAKAGATRIGLYVLSENEGAVALYSAFGFLPDGVRLSKPIQTVV